MQLSVIDELELASKCSAAVGASEGIHRSVESRVHVEMFLLCEAFTAVLKLIQNVSQVERLESRKL